MVGMVNIMVCYWICYQTRRPFTPNMSRKINFEVMPILPKLVCSKSSDINIRFIRQIETVSR